LRSQGYDPAYAIAEFVDNAVQAHLSHASVGAEPVVVNLWFYSNDYRDPIKRNSIIIEDDGPGIPPIHRN
jgi:signal transduction histidine kinase